MSRSSSKPPETLRVLSWNVRGNCGIGEGRVERVVEAIAGFAPDVLMLQEVNADRGLPQRIRASLASIGITGWHFSDPLQSPKRYGNVIASKFEVLPGAPVTNSPWQQLIATATVVTPTGPLLLFSAHMPNGSTYRWKKIETFEALAGCVAAAGCRPIIVGGDFNEPDEVNADNSIASFGYTLDPKEQWRGQPLIRWQRGVDAILGSRTTLRHAWLHRNPGVSTPTHVVRGLERFFDHILASKHFDILDAGYEHTWRLRPNPRSDHSAAWAVLQMKDNRVRAIEGSES